MNQEAWKAVVTFVTGGAFVAAIVAVFRFITSGRRQDAAEFVRLTQRIVALEKKEEECQSRVLLLSTEVAGLKATLFRIDATSGAAIIVGDDQEIIREWNSAATAMFGWASVEAIGQKVSVIVPPELREQHDRSYAKAVAENRGPSPDAAARIRESYAITKSGERIPVTITLHGWPLGNKRMYSAEIKRR